MPKKSKNTSPVDDYISQFSPDIQEKLQKVREVVAACAPDAQQVMSYGIPTFDLKKKHLVHFAAFKKHIGLFPGPEAIEVFKSQLVNYKISKGTIQFLFDEPIPFALIKKIVAYRIKKITFEIYAQRY